LPDSGPDLAEGVPAFVIAGPPTSGRSTVLMNLARSYQLQGVRLVIAAPRPSPLRQLDGQDGVLRVFSGEDIEYEELREVIRSATPAERVVVLVDDAEILRRSDADDAFRRIIADGAEHGCALVLAGLEDEVCAGFSGWQVEARKSRRGILLSPQQHHSGELIGVRVPRSAVGGQITPGTGILHLGNGELVTVRIPV
jgi:DNA segregation ATPase FtsK/SpoIIIE, S-DNA-T family